MPTARALALNPTVPARRDDQAAAAGRTGETGAPCSSNGGGRKASRPCFRGESRRSAVRVSAFLLSSLALLAAREARATNILEFPDNGSEQMGRGGAWIARASDPLATFYNPAGLAGQDTRLSLNVNITFSHTCFTRILAQNDTTQDPFTTPGGTMPRVCSDIHAFPNPQLALNWRVSDRVGIGIMPIVAPSAAGSQFWPEFDTSGPAPRPSPQRYLLLKSDVIFLTPTVGVGVEVADGLRLGGSFQWGIVSKAQFSNASPALNGDNSTPRDNDIKADLFAKDLFVPGFTLGALYSPLDELDIAAWYKWSAPIEARGDVVTSARYITNDVAAGNNNSISGDTSERDCGTGNASITACGDGGNATVKVPIPMEAKLGARFHKPRVQDARKSHRRDPLLQDKWDVELNLTWANNSVFKDLEIRFPSDPSGNALIPVNGTGGNLPPNADVPHNFKDVFGVRLGGDANVIPDKLALRAGVFYETNGRDPQFQNVDFPATEKFGFALGGTFRVRLGQGEDPQKKSAFELSLGYGHVFVGTSENKGPNGLVSLAGSPCNGGSQGPPNVCTDGSTTRPAYRTNWPVNLGTITNAINVINVGVAYKF
jgi:long-subunit fatty acid transport protein